MSQQAVYCKLILDNNIGSCVVCSPQVVGIEVAPADPGITVRDVERVREARRRTRPRSLVGDHGMSDREPTGEEWILGHVSKAKAGKTDEEISANVERVIEDTLEGPHDGVYFDPMAGWTMPGDVHQSDTHRSLKEIVAELNTGNAPDVLFDDAERVFYHYKPFIRQGVRERFGKHTGVSWYFVDKGDDERVLFCYQDGPGVEWILDAYADDVPYWLLIGLARRIMRVKPLGDQKTDETIAKMDDLDAEYVSTKDARELEKNLGALNLGGDDHDE